MAQSGELIQEKPQPLAMIICDQVITDAKTKKKTLVGAFNAVTCGRFPAVHNRLAVFVALYGGRGVYEASLTLSPESGGSPIFTAKGPIQFKDPASVVEIEFEILGIRFEEPGFYSFDFNCNDEHIFSRRLSVTQRP